MFSLHQLNHFREVARHKSFSAAAAALRLSQSNLSKAVKQIEDDYGIEVLKRGRGSKVELTPAGETLLAGCDEVLGALGNLHHRMQSKTGELSGPLEIAASDNICNYILPHFFRKFCRENPKVTLKLTSGTAPSIREDLLRRNAEWGLFYTRLTDSSLVLEELGFVPFAIVTLNKGLNLKDLATQTFIGSKQNEYGGEYPVVRMLRKLGVLPGQVIETNNQETQKRLVLAGHGFSVMPEFMVKKEIGARKLQKIKTPKVFGSELYLAKLRGNILSPAAESAGKLIRTSILSILCRERGKLA